MSARYVNIPLEVVNHRGLSDPLFRTYVQLRGLAWATNYKETPALGVDELMGLLGCSERSLRGHLAALEEMRLIEVHRRAGRLVIRFPEGDTGESEERQSFAGNGKVLP
ncbi:MAG: hypothetical protein ACK4WK_03430, partial [Anaerolineae bacterium]